MASTQQLRHVTGVVVSAGKMIKTVKVRVPKKAWNKRLQKYYDAPETVLASDPTNSTREGDVVVLEGGRRISRQVRHSIAGVVLPMGQPMSERPHIPTAVERLAAVEAKRAAKDVRQAARGRWPAIVRLREREARKSNEGTAEADRMDPATLLPLSKFVHVWRRGEHRAELDVLDFLRVADYKVLPDNQPLLEQVQHMRNIKSGLIRERDEMDRAFLPRGNDSGKNIVDNMPNTQDIAAWETKAKARLALMEDLSRYDRRLKHIREYQKQVTEAKKDALRNDPTEWYDIITSLRMDSWTQNVVALDLFGEDVVAQAQSRDINGIILNTATRFRLTDILDVMAQSTTPGLAAAAEHAHESLATEVEASNVAAHKASKESSPPLSERRVRTPNNPAAVDAQLRDEYFVKLGDRKPSSIVQETANAQRREASALKTGEKELPSVGEKPGTGPPEQRAMKNVAKAQKYVEKGLENEAQVEAEKKKVGAEQVEKKQKKEEEKSSGMFGFFKRR